MVIPDWFKRMAIFVCKAMMTLAYLIGLAGVLEELNLPSKSAYYSLLTAGLVALWIPKRSLVRRGVSLFAGSFSGILAATALRAIVSSVAQNPADMVLVEASAGMVVSGIVTWLCVRRAKVSGSAEGLISNVRNVGSTKRRSF